MVTVHNSSVIKRKRQYLRSNQTIAEKLLWGKLKNSQIGYKFRRQHSINNYIVDFYCPQVYLAVELDGQVHNIKKQRESDKRKEEVLKKLEINFIRFNNEEVIERLDETIYIIGNTCNRLKHRKDN